MERKFLDQKIRKVPNFPKEGVLFYDVTTLFEDKDLWRQLIDELCLPYQNKKIDKIVGIDARGFLLAAAMGYKLNTGISLVRKKGKLPYQTKQATYEKEYGPDTIEMHADTIRPGETVLIADDLLATGGTIMAAIDLVEQMQGKIIGLEFIINLSFLPGLKKLQARGFQPHYLIDYDNEKVS